MERFIVPDEELEIHDQHLTLLGRVEGSDEV